MQKIILASLVLLACFSCKKKEEKQPETSASTTTGSPPVVSTDSFSALFTNQLLYSIYATSASTLSYGFNNAIAGNSDFTNFNFPTGSFIDMGTVKLNGVVFKNISGYYMDSTYNHNPGPPYIQTINGKKMNFRNTTSYVKTVGVKN